MIRIRHSILLLFVALAFATSACEGCGEDETADNNDGADADVGADAGDVGFGDADDADDADDGGLDGGDVDEGDAEDADDVTDDVEDADDGGADDVTDDAADADDVDEGDAGDAGDDDAVTAVCGNDTIEGDEVCDSSALGGETCSDQGFVGGTLACNDTCDGFDTSGCTMCGNGTVDSGEECDGSALDGATCSGQGFDGGTLACASDCTFDTSQCTSATCGNGTIEGAEECDGTNLDGATCSSRGFVDGTLSCSSCQFDESGCNTCGDDAVNGSDVCDGSDLDGETCASQGFVGGTLSCSTTCDSFDTSGCTNCGNDTIDSGETCDGTDLGGETCLTQGFDGGVLQCGSSCGSFDTSACVNATTPGAGDLVITEIMQNPDALSDADGEYFELLNQSGSEIYTLADCEITGKTGETTGPLAAGSVINAGQFFTVAKTSNPGFTPDLVVSALQLANTDDRLGLECPDGQGGMVVVDEVSWDDGATFPDPTGASMNLTDVAQATDPTENDNGYWWCATPSNDLGNGDLGTPGAANEVCPTTAVEYCRLDRPTSVVKPEFTTETFYGRLLIAGITDQTTSNDERQFIDAEIGYGPEGSDPAGNPNWVWTRGDVNGAYTGAGATADEDEYETTIELPSSVNSPYDTAYRFSGDYGRTWQYCDTVDGGTTGTYDISEAGELDTTANPATPGVYFSEYVEGSSNNKALELFNPNASNIAPIGTCKINIYANGSTTPTSVIQPDSAAVIAPEGVYTFCDSSIDASVLGNCDDATNPLGFNGDDAIEFECGGTTLDVIGQIGTDPGTAWTGGGVSTSEQTLRRKCSVTGGDDDGTNAFDPSVEWDQFPQDSLGDLGTYTCP